MSSTFGWKPEQHSQKPAVLPLSTILLNHIPLHLPLCRCLRVRSDLHHPCNLALSPKPQDALPDLIIDVREFRHANFGLYQVLEFSCYRFEFG